MNIKANIQQLEPGAKVVFYELDATAFGGDIAHFHGNPADRNLVWQGVTYELWPIEAEGFERTSDQQPSPILRVGNVNGAITDLCLAFDDLVGAKITRRRTFVKYLDGVNFTEGNPTADPVQELEPDIYYIERKRHEDDEWVEFELASVLDFPGIMLPRRQIIANQCPWIYRGPYCAYVGPPVADIYDQPTTDPALDDCGKRYQSCQLRQWPDGILNYGGFLAAGLIRT